MHKKTRSSLNGFIYFKDTKILFYASGVVSSGFFTVSVNSSPSPL